MKYYVEESLSNFKFWSGGKDTADELTCEQIDLIEQYLEETSPEEGYSDTEINDFFWFERDYIYNEILHIDEDGNEIGTDIWAENILNKRYDEKFKRYIEIFLDCEFVEDSDYSEESLLDEFQEYIEDNFRDMNGELIFEGAKCHWIDPAFNDYTEQEYDEQCKQIRQVESIFDDYILLDNGLETNSNEIEIILD